MERAMGAELANVRAVLCVSSYRQTIMLPAHLLYYPILGNISHISASVIRQFKLGLKERKVST